MTQEIIIILLAVLFELAARLIPSKINLSVLDAVKNMALKLHQLIDLIIPNAKKD